MMQVNVCQGSIQDVESDVVIVNLFDDVVTPGGATGAVDRVLNGAISELIEQGDLTGKAGEVVVLYPRGTMPAKRVIVVGLGKRSEFDLEGVRKAAGVAMKRARDLKAKEVTTIVHGAGVGGLDVTEAAQATVEGSLLALYQFDAPKREKQEGQGVEDLTIVEYDEGKIEAIDRGATMAQVICAGTILARDLVNLPPNYATPTYLADVAEKMAEAYGMQVTIGDREWADERNMGGFLAVSQGSTEPPKFIVLEHNADKEDVDTIVLVGKGITFDTGGISLKPVANMWEMKSDMGGAAAVLGAMKTVGILNVPQRVVALVPCTENSVDADAYLPSDVITMSNGKTVEIISTDAEGRMVLADALVYAQRYEPDAVVDLATLTGSCKIALGDDMAAGLFCETVGLREQLVNAGNVTHERVWHMPLYAEYRDRLKTMSADMKNSGGRFGGVGTSAAFLNEFAEGYPWAHLDIATMALTEREGAYIPKGGTGFGVRLLVEFLLNWGKE